MPIGWPGKFFRDIPIPKARIHFELPQLAACVLLMFYLNYSSRAMEEWLLASDRVC